jgi:hypothetical protein
MRRCEQNMEEERDFNPADLVRVTCISTLYVFEAACSSVEITSFCRFVDLAAVKV